MTSSDNINLDHHREPGSSGDQRWTYHRCPICESDIDLRHVSPEVHDRDGLFRDFTSCGECATLFPAGANAVDAGDEIGRQAEYHARLWEEINFEQLDLLAATAMPLAWEFAEFLDDPQQSGAIIDIGAGRGNILAAVRRLDYRVGGCEPSPELASVAAATYLLGPETLANMAAEQYLAELAKGPKRVSGFIIWHVLEHMRNPMPVLRKCLTIAPDARFFIELPLAITDDIFPEHLFFPTPRTLLWVAEELGMDIELLQITEDDRLRVFYRALPGGRDPSKTISNEAMDHLEATYSAMSPAFDFFASEVVSGV